MQNPLPGTTAVATCHTYSKGAVSLPSPSSSEEDLSFSGYNTSINPREEIRASLVKVGDWDLASKIVALPVLYRRGKRTLGGNPLRAVK